MSSLRAIRTWQAFLAAGALLCSAYLWVPPLAGSVILMNLIGLMGLVGMVVGIRRHRPASSGPWWCFVVGMALFWLGDLYTYSYELLLGRAVPFPSFGDAIYVTVYPALMLGLLWLVRRRNPVADRPGVIDALIMTLGLALVSWVVLIAPYMHDDSMETLAKLVSIAYPLGDILLLAAAIRLAVDTGRRQPAFYLMASSIVALLLTDFVYGVVTLNGSYTGQLWLDAGWLWFYLLWAAAALHPSMRGIDQPVHDRETRLTPLRLGLLTIASVIAPVIAMLQETAAFDDILVVNAASMVLFMLVVIRMAGLVRQQERSVDRERVLSAAGVTLVAATSDEEIRRAAVEAARSLVSGSSAAVFCEVYDAGISVVAIDRAGAEATPPWPVMPATASLLQKAASAERHASIVWVDAAAQADLGLPTECNRAAVLGLTTSGELSGVLVIAGDEAAGYGVLGTLQALATQISLALERAALTEQIHRRAGEARLASLVAHSSDLITVLDADASIVYQSPSIEHVLGYSADEVAGKRFDMLVEPGEEGRLLHLLADGAAFAGHEAQAIECKLRHRDGTTRHFEILHSDLLADEHVRGIVLNGRDVSERRAFEEQLSHQAFHDSVTGLANRALFVERVRHAVARSRREDPGLAVVFLDLDDFKTINDSLGHAAGDQVLREVGERVAASIRASDTAARFGGDEFAILLEDVKDAQEAADTAERILDALAAPLGIEHKELVVRASIGLAVVEGDAPAEADELIRNADAAMYIAKRDGKATYRLFEPAMHENVIQRLELRADLQRAITTGQLELHYQPVVRLDNGDVVGVEALLRWRHPERGLVPPDLFVPLAEEMGLIVPMGRWVLREGCRQGREFQRELGIDPPLTMSVNLSVKQLQHSDVVADVRDALTESGLAPATLTLEITETTMMTDTDAVVRRLEELKELGVRLAMDDFGTGYSSLSYLSKLPVDILKMDRSFLREDATEADAELANAVVALGETLQLEVVAEGIELPEQWRKLRSLGCDLGQGYHFAKPMSADALLEFLRAPAGRRASIANAP